MDSAELPFFRWAWKDELLVLHLVSRHRLNMGKLFSEMIHRWLIPGHRLDVASYFTSDFKLQSGLHTFAEMSIRIDPSIDIHHLEHNLRIIQTEVRLGMVSIYHASRILEMHLLSSQEKHGILQEKISELIQRKPDEIDYDIFGELQYFMVMSKEEFKIPRDPHHLSRLIVVFYLFRKSILREIEIRPDKRHLRFKLSTVDLNLPWGLKRVIGVCVGFNVLRSHEIFEEAHLQKALQNCLAGIKPVSDSFYMNESNEIHLLYLEIEKENGDNFTPAELKHLRLVLPEEIKRTIEVPLKSLFMPRNEEEIIRYVVTLSNQLRFIKDLPQVVLIFDEQKEGDLYFTVIVVRILFEDSPPLHSLFEKDSFLTYLPDRIKRMGMLRKKHPKEANIFRVRLSSQPFLRTDYSVDLFRARQAVIQELSRLIGDLRDYNGGMIAKQIEILSALQRLLGNNSQLLESFFHSIYPVEARSIVPAQQLNKLFLLWKNLIENPSEKILTDEDAEAVYIMARKDTLSEIDPSNYMEMQLICVRPEHEEKFLGYILLSKDVDERKKFLQHSSNLNHC